MKLALKIIIISLLLIFAAVGSLLAYVYHLSQPTGIGDQVVYFTVKKGISVSGISRQLFEEGLIKHPKSLAALSRLKGTENAFQSGYYELNDAMDLLELHDKLLSGDQILQKVTIPEGLTSSKIGDLLEEAGITTAAEFVAAVQDTAVLQQYGIEAKSLEGFLFPDTYMFTQDYPAEKVTEHMVNTFFEQLELYDPTIQSMNGEEIFNMVKLASIIEREYRAADEASLMASVFNNRLATGMTLGSCATIEYIITEIQGKTHPEYLTYDDLKIESTYNTYIHQGLPPGPISNPGEIAIKAALFPAETDYRYFVLRNPNAGTHYFSHTLSEHNQAKFVYLKKATNGG